MTVFKPCIYALVDPQEPEAYRYIGLTTSAARLSEHVYEASSKKGRNPGDPLPSYKMNWIRKLLAEGRSPILVVLQEFDEDVDTESLGQAERVHIAEALRHGHVLTNATNGGQTSEYVPSVKRRFRQTPRIPNKNGRPPLSEDVRLSEVLPFRCTVAEADILYARMRKTGCASMSAYLREALKQFLVDEDCVEARKQERLAIPPT